MTNTRIRTNNGTSFLCVSAIELSRKALVQAIITNMILTDDTTARNTRRKQATQLSILFFQIMLFPCFKSVNLFENDASIGAKQANCRDKFF